MTAPARIRQADVKRLFSGAKAAGYRRARLTFFADSSFAVDAWDGPEDDIGTEGGNEWDVVLPAA